MAGKNDNPDVGEVVQMLKDYARQETVGPLKNVGRYLQYGVPGAIFIGFGLIMLAMGALRALQGEPEFDADGIMVKDGSYLAGNWSWAPYVIVGVGLAVCAAFLALRIVNKRTLDE